MKPRILIAGIGNIFSGDDAFGVEVIRKLEKVEFGVPVRLMDVGIRSIDLEFALMDDYDLTILADAMSRGGTPGTVYTIAIEPGDIPSAPDGAAIINSHALNPLHVLARAKSLGAKLNRVLLVACEPHVLDRDDSGYIGLSNVVEAAVDPAAEIIRLLVAQFVQNEFSFEVLESQEVPCHEHV